MATNPYSNTDQINQLLQAKKLAEGGTQAQKAQASKMAAQARQVLGADFGTNMNYDALKKAYGQYQTNDIYDQQVKAATDAWNAQRDRAVGDINFQKDQLAPQYQSMRNQADVVNLQNAQKLQELMASRGLGESGENVTASVNQNNARQNALNSLNTQEQGAINDLNHQIANISDPSQLNAQLAQINAQRSQALMDYNNNYDNTLYQRSQDALQQQNWQKQFDTSNSQWQQQFNAQNAQWQKEFDQNAKQFGQNYALQKMQFDLDRQVQLGNLSIDQARLALAQASASRSGSSSKSTSKAKSSGSSKPAAKLPSNNAGAQQLASAAKLYQNLINNSKKGKTSSQLINQPFRLSN